MTTMSPPLPQSTPTGSVATPRTPLVAVAAITAVMAIVATPAAGVAQRRTVQQPVVYGEDDRRLADADTPHASAVLAMVGSERVRVDGARVTFSELTTLGERFALCDGERFSELPSLARCTGVLVGPDLLLTAGHCVPNAGACLNRMFITGWRTDDPSVAPEPTAADVYACASVVAADERGGRNLRLDYALVRLDRAVAGATPVPVRPTDEVLVEGEALWTAGYPSGLPLMVDDGARVTDVRDLARDWFALEADTFEGSSGAPIFDAQDRLVGLLVRGEDDYVDTGECLVVNTLEPPGQEEATLLDWPLRVLCDAAPSESVCSDCDTCDRCPEIGGDGCGDALPEGWTCASGAWDSGDGCDCACGAYDPDCDDGDALVHGCAAGELCGRDAACVAVPEGPVDGWTCNPAWYGDGTCDCACGMDDPDCVDECDPPRGKRGCATTGAPPPGGLAWFALLSAFVGRRARSLRRARARLR